MKKNILTIATLAVLSTGVISANHHIVQYKHNFFATGNYFANGYKLLNSENKKITDSKVVNPMGATVGYLYSLNNVFSLGASVSFETGGKLFDGKANVTDLLNTSLPSVTKLQSISENRVTFVVNNNPTYKTTSYLSEIKLKDAYNISAISNVNLYSVNHFQVFAFGGIGYRLQKVEVKQVSASKQEGTDSATAVMSFYDKRYAGMCGGASAAAFCASMGSGSVTSSITPTLPGGATNYTYSGYTELPAEKNVVLNYDVTDVDVVLNSKDVKETDPNKVDANNESFISTTTTNVNTTTYHAGLGVNYSFTQNLGALLKVGYYGSYNTTVEGAKISNNSLGVNAGISFKL